MGFAVAEDREFSLPPIEERPLVTFALFSYNQEKYIREAVEGAFSQSYEPLEIIISDDCSTDNTFHIIKQLVNAYSGPHKILINKNQTNLGISSHVRHIHKISNGSVIVHAAGDDISLPDRTKILIHYLLKEQAPSLIMSNSLLINESGEHLGIEYPLENRTYSLKPKNPFLKQVPGGGQTVALKRALVEKFPDPNPLLIAEDQTLWIRANLIDGILYIPNILVKYRLLKTGVYNSQRIGKLESNFIIKNEMRWSEDKRLRIEQANIDMQHIGYKINNNIAAEIENEITSLDIKIKLLSGSFFLSCNYLIKVITNFNLRLKKLNLLKLFLIRWAPILRKINFLFSKNKL